LFRYFQNRDEIYEDMKTKVFYLKSSGWCYDTRSQDNVVKEGNESGFNLQEYIIGEDKGLLEEHLKKCSETQQNVMSVFRLQLPDGSTQRLQITSVPTCKCLGDEGYLTIFQDLNNFEGLKDIFTRLEELNLVGKIAGSVAHEVRNPLTVVRGHLQLLGWDSQLEKHQEQLTTMISEIDRAVEILTELLYMSKPSQTRMEKKNINDILNQLYQLLHAEALVNLHEIVYELEEIPDVLLDKKRFRQVVLNLVNNGLQAMEAHNKIIIQTYAKGDQVFFVVKDHGKGIPPEVLKRIGTPFLTTKVNGTGLGLAASYNIIAEHHGKIEVDTGSDGTTFTIVFDAAK